MRGNSLLCIATIIIFIVCFSQCSESEHPECLENCWHRDSVKHHRLCRRIFCSEGCKAGWHGPTCNKKCSSHCKSFICVQIDGTCSHGCQDGWTGNQCNRKCEGKLCKPPSCNRHFCDRADDKDCSEGYYGLQCQYKCSQICTSKNCGFSVEDARPECYKGCSGGRAGSFCKEHCPSRCIHCNQIDGRCYLCVNGYYGVKCENQCPEYCDYGRCDMDGSCRINPYSNNGVSGKRAKRQMTDVCLWRSDTACPCCLSGHRGKQCEIICKNCETYTFSHTCHYFCKEGYYGATCENTCPSTCAPGLSGRPLCKERRRGTVKCSNGCNRGFYGQQCNFKCSMTCRDNMCYQTDGACVYCSVNFYGLKCETPCSSGCINRHCHRNGTCSEGCKDGFYGDDCSRRCPRNCAPGLSGFPVCEGTTAGDVKCSFGCEAGYYDVECDKRCFQNCKSDVCNQFTGGCVICDEKWYGLKCDKVCSKRCLFNMCHRNGTCLRGCTPGYYGETCTNMCGNNCLDKKCHQDTIHGEARFNCTDGCVDGYKGHECVEECPNNCTRCSANGTCYALIINDNVKAGGLEDSKLGLVGIIIGGVISGGCSCACVVFVLVLNRRRRRRRRRRQWRTASPVFENLVVGVDIT